MLLCLQVLQYLLDDVSEFLSTHCNNCAENNSSDDNGCLDALVAFLNYLSINEAENFQSRKCENANSITLTTIHQVYSFETQFLFCLIYWRFHFWKIMRVVSPGTNVEKWKMLSLSCTVRPLILGNHDWCMVRLP